MRRLKFISHLSVSLVVTFSGAQSFANANGICPLVFSNKTDSHPAQLPVEYLKMADVIKKGRSLTEAVEAIPVYETRELSQLKETSYKTGLALGLSREEVESTIQIFFASGLIGGELHLKALFENEYVNKNSEYGQTPLDRVRKSEYHSGQPDLITKNDLAKAFSGLLVEMNDGRSGSLQNAKAERMAKSAAYEVASVTAYYRIQHRETYDTLQSMLTDPRKQALLALWYRGTLRSSIEGAIASAPNRLQAIAVNSPSLAKKGLFLFSLGGMGTMAVAAGLHDWIFAFGGLSAATSGVVAHTVAMASRISPRGRWLANRYTRARAKLLGSIGGLQTLIESPNSHLPQIDLIELRPIALSEPYQSATTTLQAAMHESQVLASFTLTTDIHSVESKLDVIAPTGRAALDALRLQKSDLEFLDKKNVEFENYLAARAPATSPTLRQQLLLVVESFEQRLSFIKVDVEYSIGSLSWLAKELKMQAETARDLHDQGLAADATGLSTQISTQEERVKQELTAQVASLRARMNRLNKRISN